jgi:hypothetical protein
MEKSMKKNARALVFLPVLPWAINALFPVPELNQGRTVMRQSPTLVSVSCVIALVALALCAPPVAAYGKYSQGKIAHPAGSWRCPTDSAGCQEPVGNCKICHGNFRATDENNPDPQLRDDYISPVDQRPWREIYRLANGEIVKEVGLHKIHARIMLKTPDAGQCLVCHSADPATGDLVAYPVFIGKSSAPSGLEPIGCMGCHGRDGDSLTGVGRGAGLLQHHTNAGVTECKVCHEDADPANYTPFPESVPPSYYSAGHGAFPNMPTDPCNRFGDEDFAGRGTGLDNDGDGRYDRLDSDCRGSGR